MAGRSLEPSAPSWLRYRDGVLCVRFAIVTRTSSQPLLFMHFCFVCIDALVTGIIKYYVAARSLVIFHSFIPFCSTQLFTSSLWAGPLDRSHPKARLFRCFRSSLNSVRNDLQQKQPFASASKEKPTQQTIQIIAGYCS
jgi:hypothetical protein